VADHPERFGALATLPLPDLDAARAELAHALDELHLDGVVLLSHHLDRVLHDRERGWPGGIRTSDSSWPTLGEQRELDAAVVFLASPASGYVTGSTLAVDGGPLSPGKGPA